MLIFRREDLDTKSCISYLQMSKLTLSVDENVASRAKEYAKSNGVSVSQMVETYLAAVVSPPTFLH